MKTIVATINVEYRVPDDFNLSDAWIDNAAQLRHPGPPAYLPQYVAKVIAMEEYDEPEHRPGGAE